MKVLIVGATGPTGQELVKQALTSGHTVTVLARRPDKLSVPQPTGDSLKVIPGEVLKLDDVKGALTGCDAVISALGGKAGVFTSCDVYTKSLDVILKAMKELEVKRFIACTSWGTKDDPELPYLFRWVFKPSILRNVLANMEVMEDTLLKEEEINWTVVKPPRLMDGPLTGVAPLTMEGQLVRGLPGKVHIDRSDLAKFMLDCLTTSDWDRKLVAVAAGSCAVAEAAAEAASSEGNSVDGEKK
ncbi:flavin reductase (NADPH)-like [Elysia marginata]|uniref:Flavin reductase (NADPH)-like n=1 Tax=Elysia marginata TaxID=1093978 RepID=A0AAV4H7K4_9GAST|nr:flavin reductase (NADPH)-like [Elysia marginata]